ncbi:MAG TPA: AraC family transcriptional regulator [Azospirillum sp.]|nr:AraC family transcriptional regulator [Azospirillum sp.]
MTAKATLETAPAQRGIEVRSGAHPPMRFAPHWHDRWALGAIRAGTCNFACSGGRWTAVPGDLVLIPAFAVHSASVGRQGLDMRMLYLPPALVEEVLRLQPEHGPRAPRPVLLDQALAGRLTDEDTAPGTPAFDDVVAAALRAFHADGGSAPLDRPERREPRIARLCAALQRAGARPDVEALAQELGLTRPHLARLFRRTVGLAPGEYARLMRLEHAKHLLASGHALSDVAAEAEFADQAHLTRWFKRVYGVTPAQVRAAP